VTAPNAELAYRVLDHIDAHPEQHDQGDFVRKHGDALTISADAMPCGTTACFAGWTALLCGQVVELTHIVPKVKVGNRLVDVDDFAAQQLGIGQSGMHDDAPHALFYEACTRTQLGEYVEEIFGPRPAVTA
jgi:hypothetical protein